MSQGSGDLPYNAISSLPKFLCHVVSLVDNEVLVEDLEDFAALKVCHVVSVCLIRYLCVKVQGIRNVMSLDAWMR